MKTALQALLIGFAVSLTACTQRNLDLNPDIKVYGLPERNGPDFSVTFPETSLLVNTLDIEGTRKQLQTVQLPENEAHYAKLHVVLQAVDSLSADNLVLLTEAVAQPQGKGGSHSIVIIGREQPRAYTYSDGPSSTIIDNLLLSGLEKVNNPSPSSLGILLSRCQSNTSLVELVNRTQAMPDADQWDDGSDANFAATLMTMPADRPLIQYCVGALIPMDRLNESRFNLAFNHLSHDSSRSELLTAEYSRHSSLDGDVLQAHLQLLNSDSARTQVIRIAAPRLTDLDGTLALKLVSTMAFDSGKLNIVKAIAKHTSFTSPQEIVAIVRSASFDSGREAIVKQFADQLRNISSDDQSELLDSFSFDSGRDAVRARFGW